MSNIKLPKSPVTGSNNVNEIETFAVSDIVRLYRQQENLNVEKYFLNDKVYLLKCQDVGYRFFYPFEIAGDEDFYRDIAKESEKRGLEYDRDWEADHQFAFEQIKKDEKVLEIGCNTGKFLQRIKEKNADVQGLEFNLVAAKTARQKGFDVFSESIQVHAEKNREKYDTVCAFQVLEHVTDVQPFITSALKVLKIGGKLIFSVPNNEPYFQKFSKYEVLNLPPHHVGLWNIEAFQNLCNFYDMKLIDHNFSGDTSFKGDVYLRSKFWANVKSIPNTHSSTENLKIYSLAPLAMLRSGWDFLRGRRNYVHTTVVFSKN